MSSVISDEMRASLGTVLSRYVSFPVAESDIRRWAIAAYWPEPPPRCFWDAEVAARTKAGGIVAPAEFNPFAWMTAEPPGESIGGRVDSDPDRIEKQLGISGPGLTKMLNGGLAVDYGVAIRPGDVITSVTRLGEYSERQGSLGLMLFTPQVTTWTNQRDEWVRSGQMTLIRY